MVAGSNTPPAGQTQWWDGVTPVAGQTWLWDGVTPLPGQGAALQLDNMRCMLAGSCTMLSPCEGVEL